MGLKGDTELPVSAAVPVLLPVPARRDARFACLQDEQAPACWFKLRLEADLIYADIAILMCIWSNILPHHIPVPDPWWRCPVHRRMLYFSLCLTYRH